MVSLISFRVRLKERPERVALLEPLLRQPGGATIGQLMAALGERRDIISDDLEAMRDEMGLPVRWDPGDRDLSPRCGSGRRTSPVRKGCDLALLYRAIALEEYLYVTFTTGSGETHAPACPAGQGQEGARRTPGQAARAQRRVAHGRTRGDPGSRRGVRHQQMTGRRAAA